MPTLVIDNGAVVTMDDARSVRFGGHVVMRGREVITADERQVLAEADKVLARVAGAIGRGE